MEHRLQPVLQRPTQAASRALSMPAGPSFLSHPLRPTSPYEARQADNPRKRNSEVALTELSDSDSDVPRSKKPRLDSTQKHPLLAVNPNLPPYITKQQTTVIPNPPVMKAPAASPGSVTSQPAPVRALFPPQGPVQSMNEVLSERAQVAATLHQLRNSLSTRPDIDRNLANVNAWQQHLSAIDNQIAEMQMAATPERLGVSPKPHPPALVPSSSVHASDTPKPASSETGDDAYPGHLESEGEASNAENDNFNSFASLPMSTGPISSSGLSQPAKYAGTTVPPAFSHFAFSLQKFLQDCNRDFFDANATVQKGLERLGLRDLEDTLPGMELPLMPHQVLGVAFMLDRERSTFKGGILADEMGVSRSQLSRVPTRN